MQVRRQITVKVVVTEEFRENAIREMEEAIEQVEQTKNQIDFRSRIYLTELQRVDLNQAAEFRRRMEAEKHRQDEVKEQLTQELEELRSIPIGGEYVRGAIEGFVDLQVGDDFQGRLNRAEIVIKDGVIVELRDPAPEPEPDAEETESEGAQELQPAA